MACYKWNKNKRWFLLKYRLTINKWISGTAAKVKLKWSISISGNQTTTHTYIHHPGIPNSFFKRYLKHFTVLALMMIVGSVPQLKYPFHTNCTDKVSNLCRTTDCTVREILRSIQSCHFLKEPRSGGISHNFQAVRGHY